MNESYSDEGKKMMGGRDRSLLRGINMKLAVCCRVPQPATDLKIGHQISACWIQSYLRGT